MDRRVRRRHVRRRHPRRRGWVIDRRTERRRRAAAADRFHRTPEYREFEAAMRRVQIVVGTAVYGPASRMADALRDLAAAVPAPPGTIRNPTDPSPVPRRRR